MWGHPCNRWSYWKTKIPGKPVNLNQNNKRRRRRRRNEPRNPKFRPDLHWHDLQNRVRHFWMKSRLDIWNKTTKHRAAYPSFKRAGHKRKPVNSMSSVASMIKKINKISEKSKLLLPKEVRKAIQSWCVFNFSYTASVFWLSFLIYINTDKV